MIKQSDNETNIDNVNLDKNDSNKHNTYDNIITIILMSMK